MDWRMPSPPSVPSLPLPARQVHGGRMPSDGRARWGSTSSRNSSEPGSSQATRATRTRTGPSREACKLRAQLGRERGRGREACKLRAQLGRERRGVAFGPTGGGWAFGPVHSKASDGLGVQAKEGTAPTGEAFGPTGGGWAFGPPEGGLRLQAPRAVALRPPGSVPTRHASSPSSSSNVIGSRSPTPLSSLKATNLGLTHFAAARCSVDRARSSSSLCRGVWGGAEARAPAAHPAPLLRPQPRRVAPSPFGPAPNRRACWAFGPTDRRVPRRVRPLFLFWPAGAK
jgi:hypothetical protein